MKISCSCGEVFCSNLAEDIVNFLADHSRCEPPAVTRAREILEECGIVDVQGTPADQLRPLVELVKRMHDLEKLCGLRVQVPDAVLTLTQVDYMGIPRDTEKFECYRVTK
jgi:hypothetical protein